MIRCVLGAVAALAGVATLTGCTPMVSMNPSPAATDPACAAIVVRLPQALGTAQKRETDAQGTAAWGDPPAVTLTCGVTPPGPTTDICITVGGVDWIERDQLTRTAPRYVLTTFGRTPATQVIIEAKGAVSSNDALSGISDAVAQAVPSASRHCVAVPAPSSSP